MPSMVVMALFGDGAEPRDARSRCLVVDEDGAGAAVTFATAELAARQPELVAEDGQEAVGGVTFDFVACGRSPEGCVGPPPILQVPSDWHVLRQKRDPAGFRFGGCAGVSDRGALKGPNIGGSLTALNRRSVVPVLPVLRAVLSLRPSHGSKPEADQGMRLLYVISGGSAVDGATHSQLTKTVGRAHLTAVESARPALTELRANPDYRALLISPGFNEPETLALIRGLRNEGAPSPSCRSSPKPIVACAARRFAPALKPCC